MSDCGMLRRPPTHSSNIRMENEMNKGEAGENIERMGSEIAIRAPSFNHTSSRQAVSRKYLYTLIAYDEHVAKTKTYRAT
jgi:hypothetical protein